MLTGLVPWQTLLDDAAPVVNTMKRLDFGNMRLVVLLGALMGMISSLLVFQLGQARVWFAMSRDGLLPGIFSRVHPRFPHSGFFHVGGGIPGGDSGGAAGYRHAGRSFEYRDAVRVRAGGGRRADSSLPRTGSSARVSRAGRRLGAGGYDSHVPAADGGLANHELDSFLRVAAHRPGAVQLVRAASQPALEREHAERLPKGK